MRNRIARAAVLAAGVLALTAAPAFAAGSEGGTADGAARSCGELRLSVALPVPPAGGAVHQQVTVGADCRPVLGEAVLVPAAGGPAAKAAAGPAAATTTRQVKSWNEMFDCCNIRMSGLYTTSSWSSDGARVTTASTDATQQWNREPWNAGWSLKSATKNSDCTADCAVSHTEAHAEFGYRGIFDATGAWYANTHHTYVDLAADGTATCRFDVELRHSFIGWNWQHGCQ
ncbi:hypothetical protein OH807_19970 [Kitasatospora sp. NBC_01560]|uniref:hypothetical protein n=1 Tax=Kitasatospora sp. NBC_01560 TaxID=2975965 RepID=UPI00386B3DC7